MCSLYARDGAERAFHKKKEKNEIRIKKESKGQLIERVTRLSLHWMRKCAGA